MTTGNRTTVAALAAAAMVMIVMTGRASAQDRLLQEAKDPATGATMRVFASAQGPRLELEARGLFLTKQVLGDRVQTTMRGGGEALTIDLAPRLLTVTGTRTKAVAAIGDRAQIERARQVIARSPLAARAATIIGNIAFGQRSAIEPLLITTRAFLLAAQSNQPVAPAISRWAREARSRTSIVQAVAGQRTPTDCWNAYGNEVLDAYLAYEDCVLNLHWWDPFGEKGCAVVYEVRIIGAFTWYSGCVSLGGIIGK
jgi:hypothetical protein